MKKVFLTAMAFAAMVSSVSFTSCSNEERCTRARQQVVKRLNLNGTVER